MDSGLTLKKAAKWSFIGLLSVLIIFLLFNSYAVRNYPYKAASIWHCDDPIFSLTYGRDEKGILTSCEILEWDDEILVVDVCFLMNEYTVYPVNTSAHEDRLFSGTWKYRNGNFIMLVKEDFLFDNQYSELVFSPMMPNE